MFTSYDLYERSSTEEVEPMPKLEPKDTAIVVSKQIIDVLKVQKQTQDSFDEELLLLLLLYYLVYFNVISYSA